MLWSFSFSVSLNLLFSVCMCGDILAILGYQLSFDKCTIIPYLLLSGVSWKIVVRLVASWEAENVVLTRLGRAGK